MFYDSLSSLSEKEKIIFKFISSNIFSVSKMNIKELSLALDMSEYSINKFSKKLNLDNFSNLQGILSHISEKTINNKNNIFSTTKDIFDLNLKSLKELKIENISKLILSKDEVKIIGKPECKLIIKYLTDLLTPLGINMSVSSPRRILKNESGKVLLYLTPGMNENELKVSINSSPNDSIILVSELKIKHLYDKVSIYLHLENNKLVKNYNVNIYGSYFMFIDLLASKIIEITNS